MIESSETPTALLTQDQKAIIDRWMQEKWEAYSHKRCEICGANHWLVNEELVQIVPFIRPAFAKEGPVFPLLMINCTHCANVKFINAVSMGLLGDEDEGSP